MKVLVVDDSGMILRVLRTYLEQLGHEIVTAQDGRTAISILFPDGKLDTTIHAVITDCRMAPGKSGLWLLQYLNERREQPPCLLHSSEAKHREEGMEVNLDEVPKVFPFAQFHTKDGFDPSYIKDFLGSIVA